MSPAYFRGRRDYWRGYEFEDNPFSWADISYWDWQRGWLDAEDDDYWDWYFNLDI